MSQNLLDAAVACTVACQDAGCGDRAAGGCYHLCNASHAGMFGEDPTQTLQDAAAYYAENPCNVRTPSPQKAPSPRPTAPLWFQVIVYIVAASAFLTLMLLAGIRPSGATNRWSQ